MPGIHTISPHPRVAELRSDPKGGIARARALVASREVLWRLLRMPGQLWSGTPPLWRPFEVRRAEPAGVGAGRGIGAPGSLAVGDPGRLGAGLPPSPNGTSGSLRLRATLAVARLSLLLPASLRERTVRWVTEPLFAEIQRNGPDADWATQQLIDWIAADGALRADLETNIPIQLKGAKRHVPTPSGPSFQMAMRLMTEMPWRVRDLIQEQLRKDNWQHDGTVGTYPNTPWYLFLHSAVLAGRAEAVQVLAPLVGDPVHFLVPLLIDSMGKGVDGSARTQRTQAVMAVAANPSSAEGFYPWLERQLAMPTQDSRPVPWCDDLIVVRTTWFSLGNKAAFDAELADARGGDLRALGRLMDKASMTKIGVNHQKAHDYLMKEMKVEQFTWLIATAEGQILIQRLEKWGQPQVREVLIVRGDISGLRGPEGIWDVEGLTGFAEMGSPQALGKLLELDPHLPSDGRQAAFDQAIHNYAAIIGLGSMIDWLAELGFNAAGQLAQVPVGSGD